MSLLRKRISDRKRLEQEAKQKKEAFIKKKEELIAALAEQGEQEFIERLGGLASEVEVVECLFNADGYLVIDFCVPEYGVLMSISMASMAKNLDVTQSEWEEGIRPSWHDTSGKFRLYPVTGFTTTEEGEVAMDSTFYIQPEEIFPERKNLYQFDLLPWERLSDAIVSACIRMEEKREASVRASKRIEEMPDKASGDE